MKKPILSYFFILLVMIPIQHSFSEENPQFSSCTITSVRYEIDGLTKEKYLRIHSNVKEGMAFQSYGNLKSYVEKERQNLLNRRYFNSVIFNVIFLDKSDTEKHYEVLIKIKDAVTIIPIPYPKYDSNTGLRMGLKIFWSNFIGTMTDAFLGMRIDLRLDPQTRKIEVGEWAIKTSISNIKVHDILYLSVGLRQSFDEEDFIDSIDASNSYNYSYYSTSGSLSASLMLNNKSATVDKSYTFGLASEFRYNYEGILGPIHKQPWTIIPFHSFTIGKTDWINNFRKGFQAGFSNSYRIGYNNNFFTIMDLVATGSYYIPFWKRFNFYTQAQVFYQWGEIRSVGSKVRGVKNNRISGFTGLIVNTSLAFQFWRFENVWDAQIHPFFDFAIVYNNEDFRSRRDINIGVGVDIVLYLDVLPSLVAVGSIGFDPLRLDVNHITDSLEITITSSLFY